MQIVKNQASDNSISHRGALPVAYPDRHDFWRFMFAVRNARKRAALRCISFQIDSEHARALWDRCGGRCEITGIPFDFSPEADRFKRRPFAASVDRIDNSKGYTFDNVRVVCTAVNLAMNQWGEDVLLRIVSAMMRNSRTPRNLSGKAHPERLPVNVRLYRGKDGLRYVACVRQGPARTYKEIGRFITAEAAVAAQRRWAIENRSIRVLEQVYDYMRDDETLAILEQLRLS